MLYEDLQLPVVSGRPFFYTNFVSTIDGNVYVRQSAKAYWPIGSATDYATLLWLRAHADVLIHGRQTAEFTRTVDNLGKPSFRANRQRIGKPPGITYIVVSAHPDERLITFLVNPPAGVHAVLATTDEATVPEARPGVEVLRCGARTVDPLALAARLAEQSFAHALVEGGPTLLGSFLNANLIDDIFLTIAPKVFGHEPGATLTMVEGILFSPADVKGFRLLSVNQIENEAYLRYRSLASPAV